MIHSLPSSRRYRWGFNLFIALYFVLLFAPLVVTMILAFNDSMYPSLPWEGFTLDWFFGNGPQKYGIFNDRANLRSLAFSFRVALAVTCISTLLGTCAAFLFEQEDFRFKGALYFLMIAPLVIPGVILGISILMFANTVGIFIEDLTGIYVKFLVPGFWLRRRLTTWGRTGRKCSGTLRCRSFVRPFWAGRRWRSSCLSRTSTRPFSPSDPRRRCP